MSPHCAPTYPSRPVLRRPAKASYLSRRCPLLVSMPRLLLVHHPWPEPLLLAKRLQRWPCLMPARPWLLAPRRLPRLVRHLLRPRPPRLLALRLPRTSPPRLLALRLLHKRSERCLLLASHPLLRVLQQLPWLSRHPQRQGLHLRPAMYRCEPGILPLQTHCLLLRRLLWTARRPLLGLRLPS